MCSLFVHLSAAGCISIAADPSGEQRGRAGKSFVIRSPDFSVDPPTLACLWPVAAASARIKWSSIGPRSKSTDPVKAVVQTDCSPLCSWVTIKTHGFRCRRSWTPLMTSFELCARRQQQWRVPLCWIPCSVAIAPTSESKVNTWSAIFLCLQGKAEGPRNGVRWNRQMAILVPVCRLTIAPERPSLCIVLTYDCLGGVYLRFG